MNAFANALIYGLPGLVVGFLAGRLTRREVIDQVTHTDRPEALMPHSPSTSTWRKIAGVAIGVVVLASTLLVIRSEAATKECVFSVVDSYGRQLNDSRVFAAQDRKATDDMVRAVATATTGEQVASALQTYQDARAAADAARAKQPPYPSLSDACPNGG